MFSGEKRLKLKFFLTFFLIFNFFAVANSIASTKAIEAPGTSKENPIIISSKMDFEAFVDEVNSGNTFENQYIVLSKNIYINSDEKIGGKIIDWCSAGHCTINNQTKKLSKTSKVFQGNFDGQGFTIECNINFDVNNSKGMALFGYVGDHAVIKNLGVVGYFKASNSNKPLATISDVNYGIIENCKVKSKEIYGPYGAAGICNINYGTIKNCESAGRITAKDFICAGICGINYGNIESCKTCALIINCAEKGIKGDGNFKRPESAGVTAYNYGQIINCEVKSYILNANIKVANSYEYYRNRQINNPNLHDGCAGGVASRNNGLIENCKFLGYINAYEAGGICAVNYETLSKCSTECKLNGIIVGGISAQNLVGDKKISAKSTRKLPGGCIKNCNTDGEINTLYLAGDVVCSDFWHDSHSTIENCKFSAKITYIKN